MAWEQRRNRRYYYSTAKVDGLTRKIYLGTGPEANEAARQRALAKECRAASDAALQVAIAELEPVERLAAQVDVQTDLLTEAVLLTAGCYRRRSEWRRKHASEYTQLRTANSYRG